MVPQSHQLRTVLLKVASRSSDFLEMVRWAASNHFLFKTFPFLAPSGASMSNLHIYAVLVALLLLCAERSSVNALTIQERESLNEILLVYPKLSQVGVWERYPPEGPTKYLGRPWPTDFSRVCESGGGYDIFGVYCSETGNVLGLTLYVLDGITPAYHTWFFRLFEAILKLFSTYKEGMELNWRRSPSRFHSASRFFGLLLPHIGA